VPERTTSTIAHTSKFDPTHSFFCSFCTRKANIASPHRPCLPAGRNACATKSSKDHKMKTRTASPSRLTTLATPAAIALAAILILAAPARAQHTATITWTNSVDTPQTNIYRAAGQCPTTAPTGFTKLNSTPVTTGSFADAAPLIGLSCYYVTATSNGLESVPSPLVQVSLPPAPPTAPQATAK
jgi:hypothetical protein